MRRIIAGISAGVRHYRQTAGAVECVLVHPGGPFWTKKDAGTWSIPIGRIDPGEDARAAAMRELEEETGIVEQGELASLG